LKAKIAAAGQTDDKKSDDSTKQSTPATPTPAPKKTEESHEETHKDSTPAPKPTEQSHEEEATPAPKKSTKRRSSAPRRNIIEKNRKN